LNEHRGVVGWSGVKPMPIMAIRSDMMGLS
jgi:hypothetical protein